jgi:hypothetical protein
MGSVVAAAYLGALVCFYTVLGATLGLKVTLLIFGATHLGCALLLVGVCWGELGAPLPAELEEGLQSSDPPL